MHLAIAGTSCVVVTIIFTQPGLISTSYKIDEMSFLPIVNEPKRLERECTPVVRVLVNFRPQLPPRFTDWT